MRSRSRSTTMRVATLWTAAGGQSFGNLAPQHRRDLVTVKAVEDAPCLLRVDQASVELARVLDGGADGGGRDLVEDHARDRDPR